MALMTEFYQMIKNMIAGGYPDYVMKNRIGDEIPVFVYHRVDRKVFEEQLRYLRDNRYQTLNIRQLGSLLRQGEKQYGKNIVLTFDDGLDDLYSVAYPLLRSYQFQAVAFIAPYWIGEKNVVNWRQVKEMHQSGVIDFQAHSYTHERIYVSPKIVDFFHPGFSYHYRWQFPLLNSDLEDVRKKLPPLGMPIYEFSSALSESRKYLGNCAVENFCIDCIKNKGEKFFHYPNWRNQLRKSIHSYFQDSMVEYQYESEEARHTRMSIEISQSKKIIEKKLSNKQVVAFAYPYHEYSEVADRLLRDHGYHFVFGGIKPDFSFGTTDCHHFYLRRVSGDFIFRLQGTNRAPLITILAMKAKKRLLRNQMY